MDNIIFFGSGEFSVATFQQLCKSGYNIKGLVTTRQRNQEPALSFTDSEDKTVTLLTVAEQFDIPVLFWENTTEDERIQWLSERKPDIFCVISFKKLSPRILNIPKKRAFNIHASLLPFLRGAAPINWAIRNDFKTTGLSAFFLNNDIDRGLLFQQSTPVNITPEDNFGTLFRKLMFECMNFTTTALERLSDDNYNAVLDNALPLANYGICDGSLFKAPKITSEYTENWRYSGRNVINILRSVAPIDGLPFSIAIFNKSTKEEIKTFNGKIMDAEYLESDSILYQQFERNDIKIDPLVKTDGKTYLAFHMVGDYTTNMLKINSVQMAGKKKMNIDEFLRGFSNWIKKENTFINFFFQQIE